MKRALANVALCLLAVALLVVAVVVRAAQMVLIIVAVCAVYVVERLTVAGAASR